MRVVKVKESGQETVSYTYDANGNKKSETLANGVVSTYTYNRANRIANIVNKKGNSNISVYEYSYYLDGSDACKVRNENGIIETTEYEYDGLKRLTEESVKVGNSTDTYAYEYDDYGNRAKMIATGSENYVTEYSYNNAQGKYTALLQKEVKTVEGEENLLDQNSNVKQTVYTYDANGNQIKKTAEGKTETNTYDGLNQLIGFTDGETTASYKYNASGLRYEKTVGGQTINHVWDGSKQIIADVIDNQLYEADCYIRGTNLVAKYNFCNGTKSEYTYYTQNAHGDVVNLTDETGKVTKTYKYDAFGVEKNIVDSDTNAFRYCGEYYDKETATVYLRARYYNSSTGRFISRDSYAGKNEDPLSLNRYTYCCNNPIINVDPSGFYNREAAAQYALDYSDAPNPEYIDLGSDFNLSAVKGYIEYFMLYGKRAGSDCANFTSQALHAGDISMNEDWYYESEYNQSLRIEYPPYMIQPLQPYMYFSNKSGITHRPKDYNFTSTWTVASKQYEYFSNKNNGYINGSVLKMNGDGYNAIKPFLRFFNIQKGDLMFYGNEDGIYHSTMITDVLYDTKDPNGNKIKYSAHSVIRTNKELSIPDEDYVCIIRMKNDAS